MASSERPPGGGTSRRSLIKKGLLGGAILLCGGAVPVFLLRSNTGPRRVPQSPLLVLTAAEYAIFSAAAARLCPGHGETADWPTADALGCAEKVDALLAGLHPEVTGEFRRLLVVFDSAITGLFSIGRPGAFVAAAAEQQDRRLEAWRQSQVTLFRSGYQAMKRLAHAAYFSSPEIYSRVGYPGPPVVPAVPA